MKPAAQGSREQREAKSVMNEDGCSFPGKFGVFTIHQFPLQPSQRHQTSSVPWQNFSASAVPRHTGLAKKQTFLALSFTLS